jgi:hypothetical protein
MNNYLVGSYCTSESSLGFAWRSSSTAGRSLVNELMGLVDVGSLPTFVKARITQEFQVERLNLRHVSVRLQLVPHHGCHRVIVEQSSLKKLNQ